MIFLPETPLGPAIEIAERLRKKLNENGIKVKEQIIPVTISAGIPTVQHDDEDMENIIKRTDDALYSTKHAGRNQVKACPLFKKSWPKNKKTL